jgi:hypothetical protein
MQPVKQQKGTKMKDKLEKQLANYKQDLESVNKRIQNDLTLKERLIGAIASIQELLRDFEPKKKKKK